VLARRLGERIRIAIHEPSVDHFAAGSANPTERIDREAPVPFPPTGRPFIQSPAAKAHPPPRGPSRLRPYCPTRLESRSLSSGVPRKRLRRIQVAELPGPNFTHEPVRKRLLPEEIVEKAAATPRMAARLCSAGGNTHEWHNR